MIPTQALQPTTAQADVGVSADTNKEYQALYNQSRQENKEFISGLQSDYAKNKALQIKMQAELDKAEAVDLLGAFKDNTTPLLSNFLSLQEGDAVNNLALEKFQQNLIKQSENTLNQANGNVRPILSRRLKIETDRLDSQARSHSINQSKLYVKHKNIDNVNMLSDLAISSISTDELDPANSVFNFNKYLQATLEANKIRLMQSGISPQSEIGKQQEKGILNNIYSQSISKLLENGDLDGASTMLGIGKGSNLFSDEQIKSFDKRFKILESKENGTTIAENIFQQALIGKDPLGNFGVADTISIEEMKKKTANISDPSTKEMANARLEKLYKQLNAQATENYNSLLNSIATELLDSNGKDWTDLPESVRARIKPEDLSQIKAGINKKSLPATVQYLNTHQDEKLKGNIEKFRWFLSEPKYKEMEAQGEYMAKHPLANKDSMRTNDVFNSFFNQGLLPAKNRDDIENIILRDSFLRNIDEFQNENNRFATAEEKRVILNSMLADKVREEHISSKFLFWGGNDESVEILAGTRVGGERYFVKYTGTDTSKYKYGDKIYLDGIPDDDRRAIIAVLRSEGIEPTEQNIADLWAEGQ